MSALRGAVRSELHKIRTVRSTYIALGAAFVLALAVGVADSWQVAHGGDRSGFDPVGTPFDGFQFAQLAFGVLGVLAVSTEYATGMIEATLAACPRRGVAFAAKALVVGVGTLVVGELFALIAWAVGQAVLSPAGLAAGLGTPGVARALGTAGLYLAVVSLVGLGLGALVRHTVGAVSAMFGLIFLSWPLARAVEGWSYLPDRLLLANAATVLGQAGPPLDHVDRVPSLALAYAVLAGYTVLAVAAGAWRMRRDA